ncbi:MAG: DUF3393 domain-containing protein [Bacteroidales bacterium]|nr:DUF3393 domain-containing protein [Bacteroidales bacterium]
MKKLYLILFLVIASLASHAQTYQNSITARAEKRMRQIKDRAKAKQARILAEYDEFCRKVMTEWGDKEMIESTRKEWVEYSNDQRRRSIVDFENGKVTVEIIADPEEDEVDIDSSLEKAVEDLLSSKGKTIEYESEYIPQKDVTQTPILDEQIDLDKYGAISDEKASKEEIAEQIVREEKKERRDVDTDEGRKTIVSIELELVEDHIPKRAERFKGMIRKHSGRFNVNEPLIYALIEQESYFNPMAKSSANAYGLMQLVPESGGRDAYHHIYKKDIIPTPEYLYDPDNNIELGTGYLHKQMSVYFKGVNDPRCRMLCAIAAYNTGQGNVYYALTGKRTMSNAVKKINTMTYDQLYTYLKRNLPHSETRDYIEKVTSRMQKYIKK